jgi:hypothetical protein
MFNRGDLSAPSLHPGAPDLPKKSNRKQNIKDILAQLPLINTVVYETLKTDSFALEARVLPDIDIHSPFSVFSLFISEDIYLYQSVHRNHTLWVQ